MRNRFYIGHASGKRVVFAHNAIPTPESHPQFMAVVGPFRTKRAALYMAAGGNNNPHLLTVQDAEHAARFARQDLNRR